MKYIYDYMFHLLTEYSKLLKYKPTIPKDAVEVCSDTLICSTKGIRKKFRVHSRINNVSSSEPCTMPPSWSPADLQNFIDRKQNLTKQVELWEAAQSIWNFPHQGHSFCLSYLPSHVEKYILMKKHCKSAILKICMAENLCSLSAIYIEKCSFVT